MTASQVLDELSDKVAMRADTLAVLAMERDDDSDNSVLKVVPADECVLARQAKWRHNISINKVRASHNIFSAVSTGPHAVLHCATRQNDAHCMVR